MSKILELLKEKNFYLEKFLEESKKERCSFKARRFENIDSLYYKREQILGNIKSIDRRISEICDGKNSDIMSPENKKDMATLLDKIKHNVGEIMSEDLHMISCIEDEKSKIIKEISRTREGRRVLKGYKAV